MLHLIDKRAASRQNRGMKFADKLVLPALATLLATSDAWSQSVSRSSGSLSSSVQTITVSREQFVPSKLAFDLTLSTSPNRDVYVESRSAGAVSIESRSQGAEKEKTDAELEAYFRDQLGLTGANLKTAINATLLANALVKQWLNAVKQAGYPE